MSSSITLAIVAVAILGIASLLSGRSTCCEESEKECRTVTRLKEEIANTLVGKYGLSEHEAEEIASDLLSADEQRAEAAAKIIKGIGALDDILSIMAETIK